MDDFEELPGIIYFIWSFCVVVDAVTVSKHFDECDTVFFAMCQAELDKINNFFAGLQNGLLYALGFKKS